MKREAVCAALWACLAAVAVMARPATANEWRFQVLLDDRPIGWHSFTLEGPSEARRLLSQAQFDVKLLGLTVYAYTHRSDETWRQNCLQRIDARTDDNGRNYQISGNREGDQLLLTTEDGQSRLLGCVMTFAYWNPAILDQSRLLNVQTGEYLAVDVERIGAQTLDVDGHPTRSLHYRLDTGKDRIDLWYTTNLDWLGLRSNTRGGRELRYKRVPLPPETEAAQND